MLTTIPGWFHDVLACQPLVFLFRSLRHCPVHLPALLLAFQIDHALLYMKCLATVVNTVDCGTSLKMKEAKAWAD